MREKLPLRNADTRHYHYTIVEVPEHAPDHVRVTFGESFSLELDWVEAEELAATLMRAAQKAMGKSSQ